MQSEAVLVDSLSVVNQTQKTEVRIEIQKLVPEAKIPFRKRTTDAGYDLYSVEEAVLQPGLATIVKTGLAIAVPPGFYYTIEGRSSLWMKGIFPNRGIIDATYCRESVVSLVNVSGSPFTVNKGDRIAQLILHRQYDANFVPIVDQFSDLYNQRGTDGFGSSGK
jgi:dUTP pyrophosphatase